MNTRSLFTLACAAALAIGGFIAGFAAGLPAGGPDAMQQVALVPAANGSAYPAPQIDPSAPAPEQSPTF
jgi:hypothetical protein